MAVDKAVVIVYCLLVSCNTFAVGTIIKVGNCTDEGDVVGKLISVDVNPCPSEPCIFHKGVNVTATIKFIPGEMVTDGTLAVYGIIEGIKTPFPLDQPDICEDHGLECPLKPGVIYALEINLPIKSEYPSLQLDAEMELKLPDGTVVFCFEFPMEIID